MVDYDLADVVGTSVVTMKSHVRGSASSDSFLADPAYKEKYFERFNECVVKRGMDIVQYADGSISTIENIIRMNCYDWNPKKRDFERSKKSRRSICKKGSTYMDSDIE